MFPRVLALSGLVAAVSATLSERVSREELLSTLRSTVPKDVPADFECGWRALAFEYAQQLQPFRSAASMQAVFDGLQLLPLCNQTFRLSPEASSSPFARSMPRALAPSAGSSLYVDYVNGNDGNSGSEGAPLQHIAFAVSAARALPAPATIFLRGAGVHRLSATLQLGAADSGLTITNYPGESPVVSGGAVINAAWSPLSAPAEGGACNWTTFADVDSMYDDYPSPTVFNLSAVSDQGACAALCVGYAGGACQSWTYYASDGGFGTQWDGMCFARTDSGFATATQSNTWSGRCVAPPQPPNVYKADLAAGGTPLPASLTGTNESVITLFFSPDGGRSPQRAFRARFPNADLELDLFPVGWQAGGHRVPGALDMNTSVTHVPLPQNYGPAMFQDYYFGQGGPCERFADGEWLPPAPTTLSYWCQPNGRVAGASYFVNSPVAFSGLDAGLLPHAPYASDVAGNGGVVHYWRNGHWFSMMVRIESVAVNASDGNSTTLSWSYGAFQGAEGDATGEDWYIEHVFEELDAPREFFFDAAAQTLYYFHNASAGTPPPPSWTWEVPLIACLVNVSGSPAAPATDITLSGITFTGAAASYLMPHGIPSGGDWGLSRMGAILLSGAERVAIRNSTFTRLDGNAVFLSGYTRNVTIDGNEFVWLGESAVATWGFTAGVDATAGTQPWGTVMTNNLCHEIGLYEKQVSCFFAATSAQATVANNIMFNMPRAAINNNDDMGGGSLITRNLVWATCRESQDHGPFNSWGRVPYLTYFFNGTASPFKLYDELSYNFIVAGGGANGGSFDHDDGSSFYLDHHNFEVYGGKKSDFDGHAKRTYQNLEAFSSVYGVKCVGIMNLPHAAPNDFFAEGYWNNTCILAAPAPYLNMGACDPNPATFSSTMILGNNTILVPGGSASLSVSCDKDYTMDQWLALGIDEGTTAGELPSTPQIIQWARELLSIA